MKLAAILDTIKSNIIFLDKSAKVEIKKKFDMAIEKVKDIKENYKEEYDTINNEKLKDLISDGIDAKNAEKIYIVLFIKWNY